MNVEMLESSLIFAYIMQTVYEPLATPKSLELKLCLFFFFFNTQDFA